MKLACSEWAAVLLPLCPAASPAAHLSHHCKHRKMTHHLHKRCARNRNRIRCTNTRFPELAGISIIDDILEILDRILDRQIIGYWLTGQANDQSNNNGDQHAFRLTVLFLRLTLFGDRFSLDFLSTFSPLSLGFHSAFTWLLLGFK